MNAFQLFKAEMGKLAEKKTRPYFRRTYAPCPVNLCSYSFIF